MAPIITINSHTTASTPHPHILYNVQVTINGKHAVVPRRYSEFVALHQSLQDNFPLPPKRILVTAFYPSAWIDDHLITERKAGLTKYLTSVVRSKEFGENLVLHQFLAASSPSSSRFDYEDAVPSTLSRTAALKFKAQAEVNASATILAAAYYPDWAVDTNPPEGINFAKFDLLYFAFATPNSSSTLTWDSGSQSILQRLVTSARNSGAGTKIVLSVGGWGGSYWFSQAVSSSANRATFTKALSSAVSTYGLDGIDIDWEYPAESGAGNPNSPSDAANFLSLLQSLRTALGSSKIISAAVTQLPWTGSNGKPLTNVASYASVLTYVGIMNYDVWGASSKPGPNAPLGNLCGTSTQPQASAEAAVSQWTAAGFPASQLLLGLPLYGYVSKSTSTALTGSLLPQTDDSGMNPLKGKHAKSKPKTDLQAATAAGDLSGWWNQQIPFNSLVASGALVKNSNGTYGQGAGYTMAWDNCADVPFLYDVARTTVVTYDDTYSLGDKAAFAKQSGLAGCFTWSLDQDDGVTLQNAIRAQLGKS